MSIMDIEGVIDIQEYEDDSIEVYTKYQDLARVRDTITNMGYVLEESMIIKEAKIKKEISDEDRIRVEESIERIEECDDVQSVWSDIQ